jgi:hypothetical protein
MARIVAPYTCLARMSRRLGLGGCLPQPLSKSLPCEREVPELRAASGGESEAEEAGETSNANEVSSATIETAGGPRSGGGIPKGAVEPD